MPIRAIIWDLGGVLVRTQDFTPRQELAARLGLTRHELEELVFGGDSGLRAQRGEIAVAEHWENLRQHFHFTKQELADFEAQFFLTDAVDTELVAYIRRLRPVYRTGLLSNMFSDLRQLMAEQWDMSDAFDEIIVSAEVGLMKPDARIFHLALQRLGVAPEEAVFIDDTERNVAAARSTGWHALQFHSPAQVRVDLERLLKGAIRNV